MDWPMNPIPKDYLKKFQKGKKITKEQALAANIYNWSVKKLNFAMLMRFIKKFGYQTIYEIWKESQKQQKIPYIKFFMWSIKKLYQK